VGCAFTPASTCKTWNSSFEANPTFEGVDHTVLSAICHYVLTFFSTPKYYYITGVRGADYMTGANT